MENKILLIGTTNKGKVREIAEELRELPLIIKDLSEFPDISPPEETGKSFFENALLKARYYAEKTGFLTLADDSGLEVEALGGAPGIYSARFAGPSATDEQNYTKLLNLLKGLPKEKRKARFVCVMVCYHPSGQLIWSEGVWEGLIAEEPRGNYGFGYDPVFLVKEFNYEKTAGELPLQVKNQLSHRAKALKSLKEKLRDFLKELK